jgi:hypothetical protein
MTRPTFTIEIRALPDLPPPRQSDGSQAAPNSNGQAVHAGKGAR